MGSSSSQNAPLPPSLKGQRTLAAIVLTDGVNYSAAMSVDEEHTLELVDRDLRLMHSLCESHQGQVIKSTGDGLLMYFTSALAAVNCAIAIQQALQQQAMTLPPQNVMQHRIGVHLGEVFYSGTDVMGNGVNIAARLQTCAEPGGICLSQAVYDLAKSQLDSENFPIVNLGPKHLKNIRDPIQVYQIFGSAQSSDSKIALPPLSPLPTLPLSREDFRNRQTLLNKVRSFWIKGVLETSLHDRALLELGLEERRDAVENSWGLTWAAPDQPSRPLRSGTRILDLFDELGTGGTLLILGEPGSGKTTTLLQLTRSILELAEQDLSYSLPVVFNLSSWLVGQRLEDWLVQELNTKYQAPKKVGRTWVKNQDLMLMLDGLDEVSVDRRDACVQAINQFRQTHGYTEIVVCSRIKDYETLEHRLEFQGAVLIQPLTEQQIQSYLEQSGSALEGVREILPMSPQLQELTRSPLLLSIISLAYQNRSATDLIRLSLDAADLRPLFNTYVDRMFQRRTGKRPYSPVKTLRWLHWMAEQMVQESQTVFLVERLQPTMLQQRFPRFLYAAMTGLTIGPLVGVLLFAPVLLILLVVNDAMFLPVETISQELGLETVRFFEVFQSERRTQILQLGLLCGLYGSLLWGERFAIQKQWKPKPGNSLVFGLWSGFGSSLLCSSLLFIGLYPISSISTSTIDALITSLGLGTLTGLVSGFLRAILNASITPITTLKWSWRKAKTHITTGSLWGLIIGVLVGILFAFSSFFIFGQSISIFESLSGGDSSNNSSAWIRYVILILVFTIPNVLIWSLFFQCLGGVASGILGGFSQSLEATSRPNQGIWQSLNNGATLALISGVSLMVSLGLALGDNDVILSSWLLGLMIGLVNGWAACIKHLYLRLVLWMRGDAPWNYAHFLNYATGCIFLQRVGGGYIFIHRLLLEYFAELKFPMGEQAHERSS